MDDLKPLQSGSYSTPGGAYGQTESEAGKEQRERREILKDAKQEAREDRRVEQVNREFHRQPQAPLTDQQKTDLFKNATPSSPKTPTGTIPLGGGSNPQAPPAQPIPVTPPIKDGPRDDGGGGVGTNVVLIRLNGDGSVDAVQGQVSIGNLSAYTP